MADFCTLCPRKCRADRSKDFGFCKVKDTLQVARAALHFWEEPCISGTRGSGTIFFCGCNLGCVYCQNMEISRGASGKEINTRRLCEIFTELQEKGAHNINLVTPTHYIRQIAEALSDAKDKLSVPIVYNCGGYERAEGLSLIDDYIDIFLTDMKYADNSLGKRYSNVPDYCEVSMTALEYMLNSAGTPVLDNEGIMKRGVLVRHLVLPSCREDSVALLKKLKSAFGTDSFILSLMSQYTPNGNLDAFPEINRRITSFEYNYVVNTALDLGFTNAYTQERSSSSRAYIPPFDSEGV